MRLLKRVFRVKFGIAPSNVLAILEMTAVRSTTGNYYGALRTDASDDTAETDIPDPLQALPEGYLHHLPSEVLAIVLHYLRETEGLVSAAAAPRSRPAQDLLVLPAAGRPRAVLDLWGAARVNATTTPCKSLGHTN